MDADCLHMRRALALGHEGLFTTSPNPRVGCVLVRGDAIIGEGFHARAGGPHAEVRAIADARARGLDTQGATAYVTLEPCNHTGRTGPCTEALLTAGVVRVVAAMADPNPNACHGAERLAEAGIAVDIGLMEDEARALNPGFVSRMTRGRPWVRMKIAASLDGRTALASGESQWITGAEARADGHAWRARACAILTGSGTVVQDDPQLNVRGIATTRQPLRVVLDRHAETPSEARVFADGNVLVVTPGGRNPHWPAHVESVGLPDAQGRVDLAAMLRVLAERGINELHVEAGAGLNGALLAAGLVDELVVYLAPSLLGDVARGMASLAVGALAERIGLTFRDVARVGADVRVIATVGQEGG
ncbi:MAG: bifunctional diaminohydroxyphosphoribosylaminopyrimidine deaminase/5-amino-6-(5-phosphoribosylamino)uracil reductase RibD [Casimicrobiaceae bacterium]